MSQYPGAYGEQQFGDPYGPQRKTSGMAITALVLSLVGIIPCCFFTAPIGLVLGIISFVTVGANPMRKGRGFATAAIIIGLLLSILWGWVGIWGKDKYDRFVVTAGESPKEVLKAGFAGDFTSFRSNFHGSGATAPDAEAQAFIDELRSRYGSFVNGHMDQQGQFSPDFGNPVVPIPYRFEFDNATMNGEAEVVTADKSSGQWVFKLQSITVHDPMQGDLTYPIGVGAGGGGPRVPATRPAGTNPAAPDQETSDAPPTDE